MWTRKELKIRAKEALQRNYWKIMLVAALAAILSGGLGSSAGSSSSRAANGVVVANEDGTEVEEGGYGEYGTQIENETRVIERIAVSTDEVSVAWDDTEKIIFAVSVIVAVLVIIVIAFAIMLVFMELLYNPFYVGVQRFMLKSVDDRAEVKEVAYGFDHSYKNIVKTMFHMDIQVFLWALLFVIPGIYKRYQYRMVSYILAEHPDMDYKEVLQRSKDMMNGEKWHAFVLDLSFILWHMLGMITCGMVELFYVSPYVWLTNAALYRKLEELQEGTPQAALPDNRYSGMEG
ncbi:MAG: DUF975 family protein [Lachnospiraceae bacterium]|nr:DUF975 family protein [Lachnospiraceae bacterium]